MIFNSVIQKNKLIRIILGGSSDNVARYTHTKFYENPTIHYQDMASIHFQSLYIGRFYKVVPNPDHDPDHQNISAVEVSIVFLMLAIIKSVKYSI